MEWFQSLFFSEGAAQTIIILALVISSGFLLSRIRIAGISLGVTWILFSGILFSNLGLGINSETLHFVKEFGLILFVFSIGLQVGPGFFSSLRKEGLKLNMMASGIVILGVAVALSIAYISGTPIPAITGMLSGAVTNTPGLGAAQQTFTELNGVPGHSIATGYAIAYPGGVLGIIFSLIMLKRILSVNLETEKKRVDDADRQKSGKTSKFAVLLTNKLLFDKSLKEIKQTFGMEYVVSRVRKVDSKVEIAKADVIPGRGGRLLIVASLNDKKSITAIFGKELEFIEQDWETDDKNFTSRKIIVTKRNVNGRSLTELKLGKAFGITVTRITRAGVDLLAKPDLKLQIGDSLTVIGSNPGLDSVSKLLGNSVKQLREPNLISLFLGIAAGILLGSIPILIPGIPQPVKLGLAGGPLIIAILISRFGPSLKLVTYTTVSANLMLREVGISLFLACVGLDAGASYIETITTSNGLIWMGYGAMITIVPLLIMGLVARFWAKLDFFSITGLLSGSTTDPPALAYAGSLAGNDLPAVSYATVYPLTMFLRVLSAQLLILLG